jgi:hypothetical protein
MFEVDTEQIRDWIDKVNRALIGNAEADELDESEELALPC